MKIKLLVSLLIGVSMSVSQACTFTGAYQCNNSGVIISSSPDCGNSETYIGDGFAPECYGGAYIGSNGCTIPTTDPYGCVFSIVYYSDYCGSSTTTGYHSAIVSYEDGQICFSGG